MSFQETKYFSQAVFPFSQLPVTIQNCTDNNNITAEKQSEFVPKAIMMINATSPFPFFPPAFLWDYYARSLDCALCKNFPLYELLPTFYWLDVKNKFLCMVRNAHVKNVVKISQKIGN